MRMLRTQIKWIMICIVALFVVSVLFMYGPMRSGSKQNGQRDHAVAEIDGEKILRSQIEEGLQRMAQQKKNMGAVTSADLPGLRRSVLDSFVLERELGKEARVRGFTPSEKEVDIALNKIKDQFPTIEAFNQYVERNGIELKELRKQISSQIAQQKLVDNELSAAMVTSGDVAEYYGKVKDVFFRRPKGWEVNVARFKVESMARDALQDLGEGQSWDVVMAEKSADIIEQTPYQKPVFFPESAFTGEFAQLASLDIGQYSGPLAVASEDVAIFLKRAKLASEVLPLDEVSGDIKNLLLSQKQSGLKQKFFQSLIERADLVILDEPLFKVVKAEPASGDHVEVEAVASGDKTE